MTPPGKPAYVRWSSYLRFLVLPLVFLTSLSGCATPDLKPFADSTTTVGLSVKTGGDLAIVPLKRKPLWDGSRFVQPDEAGHPAKPLEESWLLRRKTMDAVTTYSASLAAISEAAAQRRQNAADLVGSVKQLAGAVPGINVGASAAGDLVISGLGVYLEVKAWHNMRKAVAAADPAIQEIAKILRKDLAALSDEFESKQRDQIIQMTVALRPVDRYYQNLLTARTAQRTRVEADPSDVAAGNELSRLDTLLAGVTPERTAMLEQRERVEQDLADGKGFFLAALDAVDAWAQAHQDLENAFEQKRSPNLSLLMARAQELQILVQNLRAQPN
jgi:hypothetical protein